ncbi:hypothetical protein TNCV_827781 [Trichonephila clavipes]|nr:hypothetical protein TNCV_827781 [Trichonephila clavipes]
MSQKADGRRPLNAGPAVEKGICREAAGHAKALKLIALPEGASLQHDHRFKIEHRTESIRQVTANENITIPPRTEIIVPGYIGNDVSFNSGLIGSAENKANGLLIASTLVDLSRKLSR